MITVLHVNSNPKQKARGVCLIACYLHFTRGFGIKKIEALLGDSLVYSLVPFRDAGIGPADYPLSLTDILRGLQIGMSFNWINAADRFLELSNLECSWILPRRIMACASPSSSHSSQYPSQSP